MVRRAGCLIAIVLAQVSLAHATQELTPEPTQRYRVTAVGMGDRLNVREQPDPRSSVVATLAPDAADLIVAGTRVEIDGGVWWQILTEDAEGWVNARFLAPTDDARDDRESFPLMCLGTEPFWSAEIGEDARFDLAGADPEEWEAGSMIYASGLLGRFAAQVRSDDGVGHLAAWRNYQFCSDGMSDVGYPFEGVLVTPDGSVFGGCCRRAGE